MRIEVLPDADEVALSGAALIADEWRAAVHARRRFVVGISGGRTPWRMLQALSEEDVPWDTVHFFQVDERVAPAGHADRNLTHFLESLQKAPLRPEQIHAMPVEEPDLDEAVGRYLATLEEVAGSPATFDLIHLGLGPDGHTASLVPGDPVLDVTDSDVALTGPYQNRRRMTLTYPILNRAHRVVWLVTGSDKAEALARLRQGDRSIPAGRVNPDRAVILTDQAAAGTAQKSPTGG